MIFLVASIVAAVISGRWMILEAAVAIVAVAAIENVLDRKRAQQIKKG